MFFKIRNHTVFPSVLLALIAASGVSLLTQHSLGLTPQFPLRVTLLFTFGAAGVAILAAKHLPPGSFGPANRVTLARGAMTALLLAMFAENANPVVAWFTVTVALAALALDGVDGWLARRHGDSSDFGARFDMETDALLIFSIAVLTWQHGKAGAWILAAALLRYGFVASSYLLPWLKRPLPNSRRRRVICVVQILTLIFSLLPIVPSSLSWAVALSGLVLLSASFAIDIEWLVRAHRAPGQSFLKPVTNPDALSPSTRPGL